MTLKDGEESLSTVQLIYYQIQRDTRAETNISANEASQTAVKKPAQQ